MTSLSAIIARSTEALASITPQTLTPDRLAAAMATLDAQPIDEAIEAAGAMIPAPPTEDGDEPSGEAREALQDRADALNKEAGRLKKELDRVKDMQETLRLPQLDALIHSAQRVLRPIYQLTARMG